MTQEEFLKKISDLLETARIPYMVAGSHSSSHHGQPRATNDVDLVIDPTPAQLGGFLALLGGRYYVSSDAAREALVRRSMFNVIDFSDGWKADLIVRKDRPYSIEEFGRRRNANIHGREMPTASPEDVILTKLEWNKISPSERQVRDALNVAIIQSSNLDKAYLRTWASTLGVSESLEEILRTAENEPHSGKPLP